MGADAWLSANTPRRRTATSHGMSGPNGKPGHTYRHAVRCAAGGLFGRNHGPTTTRGPTGRSGTRTARYEPVPATRPAVRHPHHPPTHRAVVDRAGNWPPNWFRSTTRDRRAWERFRRQPGHLGYVERPEGRSQRDSRYPASLASRRTVYGF